MVLTALRGAIGFLSRIPVGNDESAWRAFRARPVTAVAVGYLVGVLTAPTLLLPASPPTAAVAFVAWGYLLTGITHVDGVADVGDALVVHGDAERRLSVMRDTEVGTGGALAVAVVVFGLGTAGLAVATLPPRAVALVVVAEVGAKFGVTAMVCLGTATHEGLASALTESVGPWSVVPAAAVAAPALLVTWPRLAPPVAALLGAAVVTVLALAWSRRTLGGVSGDVMGATNELARIAALHAGVLAWTLS